MEAVLKTIEGIWTVTRVVVASIFAACVAIFLFFWFQGWSWEYRALPEVVGISRVLDSDYDGCFGCREACTFAVYQLSPRTIAGIKERGIEFFEGDSSPPDANLQNPYSGWRETPYRLETYADGASDGCVEMNEPERPLPGQVWSALYKPGSFFILTENREGMIIVDPSGGLAGFFYYG
jgi:hypothetical protein